jgi:hypothetical protein
MSRLCQAFAQSARARVKRACCLDVSLENLVNVQFASFSSANPVQRNLHADSASDGCSDLRAGGMSKEGAAVFGEELSAPDSAGRDSHPGLGVICTQAVEGSGGGVACFGATAAGNATQVISSSLPAATSDLCVRSASLTTTSSSRPVLSFRTVAFTKR